MLVIVCVYLDLIKKEIYFFDVFIFDYIVEDLRNDFCQFVIFFIKCCFLGEEKVNLMKWIFNCFIGNNVIYDVGIFLMIFYLWIWIYF